MSDDLSPAILTGAVSNQRCDFDPNVGLGAGSTIVNNAGLGSVDALRILVDVSMESALAKRADDPYAVVAAAEALGFARLCAAHRAPTDVRKLAGALCLTADRLGHIGFVSAANDMMGETIALLERLTGEGDDIAAMASGRLVTLHPATVEIAKSLLSRTGA